MGLPEFVGGQCDACEKCVAICPGLAVTLVDAREDPAWATVTIPYEFTSTSIAKGDTVTVLDTDGVILGNVEVTRVREAKIADRCLLVRVRAPHDIARQIAGIRVQEPWVTEPCETYVPTLDDDMIVCRCERVTAGEIRSLIKSGLRDLNELKAITRAGMGACGGKTCPSLIKRLFREEGVPDSHEAGITEPVAPFMTPMVVDIRPTVGSKNYYFYQHKPGGGVFCITPDPPIVGTEALR